VKPRELGLKVIMTKITTLVTIIITEIMKDIMAAKEDIMVEKKEEDIIEDTANTTDATEKVIMEKKAIFMLTMTMMKNTMKTLRMMKTVDGS